MSRGHTKRNIKKSRSKQRVSRKTRKVRKTRKQRGGIPLSVIPLGALVGAYLLYNYSNGDGDMDMDVKALSKNLGLTGFDQSFTQEAKAELEELKKLMGGDNGNDKYDFDGMCNVLEIARKWESEGKSDVYIKDVQEKLKAKINNLLKKGATKEQISDETWKCLAGYRGKGGKKIQRGGIGINNVILGAVAIALGASYMDRNKPLKRVTSVWGDL
jgi:hypothetical protein